jgi:hypothetical protein
LQNFLDIRLIYKLLKINIFFEDKKQAEYKNPLWKRHLSIVPIPYQQSYPQLLWKTRSLTGMNEIGHGLRKKRRNEHIWEQKRPQ